MKNIRQYILATIILSAVSLGAQAASWNYDSSAHTGPDYWGDLSAEYHMCKDGMKLSPIDIRRTKKRPKSAS